MKIVLVTGTRETILASKNSSLVVNALKEQDPDFVIHGACPTGIDRLVSDICFSNLVPQIPMPAKWEEYKNSKILDRRQAGPDRNYDMCKVAAKLKFYGHDVICLAFPKGESWSGTRNCMSSAEKWGIEVIEHML